MKKIELNSEYSAFIDNVDKEKWNNIIQLFRDATGYQTWEYNLLRSKKYSTLIIKHKDEIVAAAMVRLITLNSLKIGIAYLGLGPLWRLKNKVDNINSLQNILDALRKEYVIHRKLYLQISPYIFTIEPNYGNIIHTFEEAGFKQNNNILKRTLFLDLKQSEEDIRKGFSPSWRRNLNQAEKLGFSVRLGTGDDLFKSFKGMYIEMIERKRYSTEINITQYEELQATLPENLKPIIIICELENCPMSGGIFSMIGETGLFYLRATSDAGTKNNSSYIVQWEMIRWMKKQGLQMYNLNGVNPERVPSVYHFKAGIVGKNHTIYQHIGIMEACVNPLSKMAVYSGLYIQKLSKLLKKLI